MVFPELRIRAPAMRTPPTCSSPDLPSRMSGRHGLAQFGETLLGALADGVQREVGFPVERFTRIEDPIEILHGFGVALHRPKVALRDDPRHVLRRRCLDPHGETIRQQQIECLRLGADAAPDRHDDLLAALDDALEAAALDAAVARLAVEREYFAQADSGVAFDLAIEFHERQSQLVRKRTAQRRLAPPPQSHQPQASLARGGLWPEVAHQPEHDILELAFRKVVEEAADQ